MKKLFSLLMILTFALTLGLTSCTENQRAKQYGGAAKMRLEANEKLVTLTWKDDNLWVLTRPMRPGEKAETYKFVEESSYGVFEGSYTVIETKTK